MSSATGVDAEIVIHARLADGRHQQRGRLLAALVAAGRLSGFERHEQALGEITPLAVTRAKGPGHRRDDVGTGQHVAGDRELVGLLVTAPRHAARPGVAERALTVQPVYLTKLAVTVFSKQGAQRDIDRHPLGHERQALTAEIGVDPRLRGDGSSGRDPRHEAADVRPRGGDGDTEGPCLTIARRDGKGVKINHLFKL